MRRFEKYPIYINDAGSWWEVRNKEFDTFYDRYYAKPNGKDKHMMDWLSPSRDGWGMFEIMEETKWSAKVWNYENQVYQLLRLIASTKIGKLLFDSLDPNERYWIVPKDAFGVDCGCQAVTFPGTPKGGGGIRVYLTPSELNYVQKRFEGADDILFHEMVHAYRMGRVGFCGMNSTKMNENGDGEEFYALQMQNVYLGQRGATRFYRDYRSLRSVSKGTAYQYMAGDADVLMGLRWYLDHEPLAATVASWTRPADSFNAWRDQPNLERLFLNDGDFGGLQHLADFGYHSACR